MVQGGDFVNGDGTGSATIWDTKTFADEGAGLTDMKHEGEGVLSMAVSFIFSCFYSTLLQFNSFFLG